MRKRRSEMNPEELESVREKQRRNYYLHREEFLAQKRQKYSTDEKFRESQKARCNALYHAGMEEIFKKRADEKGYGALFARAAKNPRVDILEVALQKRDEEFHEDPDRLTPEFLKEIIRSRRRK